MRYTNQPANETHATTGSMNRSKNLGYANQAANGEIEYRHSHYVSAAV